MFLKSHFLTGINSDMFGSLSLILETHNVAQLWAGVHLQTSELVNFGETLHWRRFQLVKCFNVREGTNHCLNLLNWKKLLSSASQYSVGMNFQPFELL